MFGGVLSILGGALEHLASVPILVRKLSNSYHRLGARKKKSDNSFKRQLSFRYHNKENPEKQATVRLLSLSSPPPHN